MRAIKIASVLIFLLFSSTWAYLEPSFRIKALGEDFVGIIVDEYTDIFRNPAYLALVQNYKVFGEYRKDGGSRFILGSVLRKQGLGNLALLGKGWEQKKDDAFQIKETNSYYYYPSYTVETENLGNSSLINPNVRHFGAMYALDINPNFLWGLNFIYFDNQFKWNSQNSINRLFTNDSTQQVLQTERYFSQRSDFDISKFVQFQSGVNFLSLGNLSLDLIFTFQHQKIENTNGTGEFYDVVFYDTLGNVNRIHKEIFFQEVKTPLQKGNTFGLGLRVSKTLAALKRLNLLGSFSYSDWDTQDGYKQEEYYEDSYFGDTNSLSEQQFFKGSKQNMDMSLKFGLESKDTGRFKLYAGIANFLGLERRNYPDFLPSIPTKKWRNNFYKISLPLALEFTPIKNGTLRYGILPSYIYSRSEKFDEYYFRWTTSIKKNMKFDDTFGLSYIFLKHVTIEGYLLQFGNLLTVDHWMIGVSYNF